MKNASRIKGIRRIISLPSQQHLGKAGGGKGAIICKYSGVLSDFLPSKSACADLQFKSV
jgi:hypothetical protein